MSNQLAYSKDPPSPFLICTGAILVVPYIKPANLPRQEGSPSPVEASIWHRVFFYATISLSSQPKTMTQSVEKVKVLIKPLEDKDSGKWWKIQQLLQKCN